MSTSKNGFMELDLLRLSPKKWAYFQDGRIKRSTSVNPWRWTFMKHSPLKMGSILLTHNSPLPFDYIKKMQTLNNTPLPPSPCSLLSLSLTAQPLSVWLSMDPVLKTSVDLAWGIGTCAWCRGPPWRPFPTAEPEHLHHWRIRHLFPFVPTTERVWIRSPSHHRAGAPPSPVDPAPFPTAEPKHPTTEQIRCPFPFFLTTECGSTGSMPFSTPSVGSSTAAPLPHPWAANPAVARPWAVADRT